MMNGEEEDEVTPFETSPLSDHQMTKFTFDTTYSPRESHRFSNRIANVSLNLFLIINLGVFEMNLEVFFLK